MSNYQNRQRGLTLIELLAGIATVLILVALSAAPLGGFFERSNISKCAANLRQIAMATTLYAGENNGALPLTGSAPFSTPPWYNPLAPYISLKMKDASVIALDPALARSNKLLQSPSYKGAPREVSYAPSVTWANQRITGIPASAQKIWVVTSTDSYSVNPSGLQRFNFGFSNQRAQVVFFDGRVELLKREQLQAMGPFPFNLAAQ